jgi:hypothetical protein
MSNVLYGLNPPLKEKEVNQLLLDKSKVGEEDKKIISQLVN